MIDDFPTETIPTGFILSEDKALKNLMKGMTVADEKNSARDVGVWFGLPDKEIREQAFAYVTIDLVNISEATERVMRGEITLPYVPVGMTAAGENEVLTAEYPTPYDLDYQVTTWARHPRHDRQLLQQVITTRLPHRWGQLVVEDDETIRRLDVMGFAKRDAYDSNGKRLFRNIWTVRISSELYFWQAQAVTTAYTGVTISIDTTVQALPPAP